MARPVFVFAHGAGAPAASAWMQRWEKHLSSLGIVETFDYPYMAAGKRRPDPMKDLMAAHATAIEQAMSKHDGDLVLVGKSMGSRVGCHIAAEGANAAEAVRAVVCLGYPLLGMGKRVKIRDEVLLALNLPILFVQGTRDSLCPLDTLREVRAKMRARNDLYEVPGGSHSLEVGKRQLAVDGDTQQDVDRRALAAIERFLGEVLT